MSDSRTVRLSGGHTLPAKIVALIFDVTALFAMLVYSSGFSLGPFLFVAAAAILQAPIWQAKALFAEDAGLRVRGIRREAMVGYGQIAEVRRSWSTGVVHVFLRAESPFGRRLVFLPPGESRVPPSSFSGIG